MIASHLLVISATWTPKLTRDASAGGATISRWCGQILRKSRIKLARDRATARSTIWANFSGNSEDLEAGGGA